MRKTQAAIHPDDDFHYNKLGLTRNKVELWEDGMRTDGSRGTYEWWYFDSSYPAENAQPAPLHTQYREFRDTIEVI